MASIRLFFPFRLDHESTRKRTEQSNDQNYCQRPCWLLPTTHLERRMLLEKRRMLLEKRKRLLEKRKRLLASCNFEMKSCEVPPPFALQQEARSCSGLLRLQF